MTREEIALLAEKITSGEASDEEILLYNRVFRSFLPHEQDWDGAVMGDKQEVKQRIFDHIAQRIDDGGSRSRVRNIRLRWAVAAAIALLVGTGLFYLFVPSQAPHQLAPLAERFKNDIPAPGNKAVLTLPNGRQILLDSTGSGIIAVQGQLNVTRQANGQIAYSGEDDQVSIHTISNPKGSRPLSLLLADGTKVWLNVASSLRFPTAFKGKERKVEMTGEGYFEVAPNEGMPFIVEADAQARIVVLGTDFNIKAYDKSLEATLLKGAVRVQPIVEAGPAAGVVLKPGQQASYQAGESIRLVQGAQPEQVLAWKNGLFYFSGSSIRQIMTELERYYDVEVAYEATVNDQFVAKLPRDLPVSQLLNLLELTNQVHFKIEGRKITVIK